MNLRHAKTAMILFCGLLALPSSALAWSPGAVLRDYVKSHYPWAQVDVSDVRLSGAAPAAPPASIMVEKTPPGRSVFRLRFRGGSSLLATATVKAFDRVYMSRSSFRKGHVLGPDDVYATFMQTGRIPKGAIREAGRVEGKPLLRSVVPNVPLTDAMVSATPLVRRGRRVVLCVEAPGFSIRTAGVTKDDAAVGDDVKVANLYSKKVVTGLLVDENTVRVEF